MCGRYVSPDQAAIEREFSIQRRSWNERMDQLLAETFAIEYNVAPSQQVPVIRVVREQAGEREGLRMRWGLIPWFARGEPPKYSTINARAETLDTAAAFKGAWQRGQRCIVPVCGFYEWQLQPDGKTKRPFYIRPAQDGTSFPIAGLWDRSITSAGEAILSCTVITVAANALLERIHNTQKRMPAILRHDEIDAWLTGPSDQARQLLKPYPADEMLAWPVSTLVNSPKNQGADLILAQSE